MSGFLVELRIVRVEGDEPGEGDREIVCRSPATPDPSGVTMTPAEVERWLRRGGSVTRVLVERELRRMERMVLDKAHEEAWW